MDTAHAYPHEKDETSSLGISQINIGQRNRERQKQRHSEGPGYLLSRAHTHRNMHKTDYFFSSRYEDGESGRFVACVLAQPLSFLFR